MAHPEQPGKNIDKTKAQQESVFTKYLDQASAIFGANAVLKIANGKGIAEQLATKPESKAEKVEKLRTEADKICEGVLKSEVLKSPEYKKLEKSLRTKINAADVAAQKGPDGGNAFVGEIKVNAEIKGKDGKKYSVELSYENFTDEDYHVGGHSVISFINDTDKRVTIDTEYEHSNGPSNDRIGLVVDGEAMIVESSDVPYGNGGNMEYGKDGELTPESQRVETAYHDKVRQVNASYDRTMTKPNIAGVIKLLGGEIESATKGEK